MLTLFAKLSKLISLKPVNVDNLVFKFYYRVTVILLIAFSIILSAKQFVGEPIQCHSESSKMAEKLINNFCWFNGTVTRYTNERSFDETTGRFSIRNMERWHTYYQWVVFVLFFQAVCFYFPRFIWKTAEGNMMKTLSENMKSLLITEDVRNKRLKLIKSCFNKNRFASYTAKFMMCEILNLMNAFFQFRYLNYFFDGLFNWYDMTKMYWDERGSQLSSVMFPLVTECPFQYFGPNAGLQKFDALCILPLNLIHKKIFVFLWMWYHFLITVTACCIVYRFGLLFFRCLRYRAMRLAAWSSNSSLVKQLCKELSFGDWFFLYQLNTNVDREFFEDLMNQISELLRTKNPKKYQVPAYENDNGKSAIS